MILDATLTMKTSPCNVLEDDLNVVKLAVQQHTSVYTRILAECKTQNKRD